MELIWYWRPQNVDDTLNKQTPCQVSLHRKGTHKSHERKTLQVIGTDKARKLAEALNLLGVR